MTTRSDETHAQHLLNCVLCLLWGARNPLLVDYSFYYIRRTDFFFFYFELKFSAIRQFIVCACIISGPVKLTLIYLIIYEAQIGSILLSCRGNCVYRAQKKYIGQTGASCHTFCLKIFVFFAFDFQEGCDMPKFRVNSWLQLNSTGFQSNVTLWLLMNNL